MKLLLQDKYFSYQLPNYASESYYNIFLICNSFSITYYIVLLLLNILKLKLIFLSKVIFKYYEF